MREAEIGPFLPKVGGQSMSALPGISDLDLFRDGKSVVHLNAE